MAITIKELLAADSISEAVDKINFNFDQLLLNGGGPVGSPGGPGGPGIPGPQGKRGSIWHNGTSDPNAIQFTQLSDNDYYLQSETDSTGNTGDVWIYNQINDLWTNTGVNLQGSEGDVIDQTFFTAGASIITGNNILDGIDFSYLLPDNNLYSFLTTDVKSLLLGGYPFNSEGANPSNPNAITSFVNNINSTNGILFINSPNTAPQIVFSSTNSTISTSDITEMSSLESDTYDIIRLRNKRRTDTDDKTLNGADFSGITISTLDSDIELNSARDIKLIARGTPLTTASTGTLPTSTGNILIGATDGLGAAYTDYSVLALSKTNTSGNITSLFRMGPQGANGAKIDITSVDDIAISKTNTSGNITSLFRMGPQGANGAKIDITSADDIQFTSNINEYRFTNLPNIALSINGLVIHDAQGKIGSINIAPSFDTGVLSWDGTQVQTSNGTDLAITRWNGDTELTDSLWFIDNSGNMYPNSTGLTLGTEAKRIGNIFLNSVIDYSNTINFRNNGNDRVKITPSGNTSIKTDLSTYDLNINNTLAFDTGDSYIRAAVNHPNGNVTPSQLYILGASSQGGNAGNVIIQGGLHNNFYGQFDGGSIYLVGGEGGGISNGVDPYIGNVFVGVKENGDSITSSLSVRKSDPEYPLEVDGLYYDFAARFSTSRSAPTNIGALRLTAENDDRNISFYPFLPTGSILNAGIVGDDAGIIFNHDNGPKGLIIAPEGIENYVRISAINGNGVQIIAKENSTSDVNIESTRKIELNHANTSDAGVYIGSNGSLPPTTTGGSSTATYQIAMLTVDGAEIGKLRRMSAANVKTFIGLGAKSFVIQHPDKKDNYLVHACLEGPEVAVYYRGESKLKNGIGVVKLPDYFESLTEFDNRTVQITPKIENIDDDISSLAAGKVENGEFYVKAINKDNLEQPFYWEVKAVRKDVKKLEVEPSKEDYELRGDGPYTYLVKK